MAVTKSYLDAMVSGLTWHLGSKPNNPQMGDCYVDHNTAETFVWQGTAWVKMSGSPGAAPEPPFMPPTKEQLEKHPALKEAWEEFLVLKKLIGV